jgi:sugar (pentulose or hexulose) kinase
MPKKIREFCKNTGQTVPETDGAVIRCIYESLAMKYKYTFLQLKECCGKDFSVIHMIGGGTKDTFLCQMAANAANVPVVAGPIEGTAAGNVAVQLIANGEISDIWEARKIIAKSFDVVKYEVEDNEVWENAYPDFVKIVGCK